LDQILSQDLFHHPKRRKSIKYQRNLPNENMISTPKNRNISQFFSYPNFDLYVPCTSAESIEKREILIRISNISTSEFRHGDNVKISMKYVLRTVNKVLIDRLIHVLTEKHSKE